MLCWQVSVFMNMFIVHYTLAFKAETEIGGFFSLIRHDMIMLGFRKDEVVTHGILMRTQLSGSHDKIR